MISVRNCFIMLFKVRRFKADGQVPEISVRIGSSVFIKL